jgi:hypothetical protein
MTYITVDIDIDDALEQIRDEDIKAEYESRNLGNREHGDEMLTRIWIHDREGRKDEAYELMREYVLDKLNKVV